MLLLLLLLLAFPEAEGETVGDGLLFENSGEDEAEEYSDPSDGDGVTEGESSTAVELSETEAVTDGVSCGVVDGVTDGVADGVMDGVADGDSDGGMIASISRLNGSAPYAITRLLRTDRTIEVNETSVSGGTRYVAENWAVHVHTEDPAAAAVEPAAEA